MADHFKLWAIAHRNRDPLVDFVYATRAEQLVEAGAELRFSPRFFKRVDLSPLPVGTRFVAITGDLYELAETAPGLHGIWIINELNIPAPKFPPIVGYRFQGDVAGLGQVTGHANWYAVAAEPIGEAVLPPAWVNREPEMEMTPAKAANLRNFVIGTCEAAHVDLVTAWFDVLTDKYTYAVDPDPAALHFTPLDFAKELVRYTT